MNKGSRKSRVLLALVVQVMLFPRPSWSQTTTGPGEFIVEPPTLLSLGFEWKISGDDNRNARAETSYRRKSEQQWHKGLPLLRIQHEWVNGGADRYVSVQPTPGNPNGVAPNPWAYDTGNMFAGSILNLVPDTEYECRFTLSDPDGVTGPAEKTVTVRTRKELRVPFLALSAQPMLGGPSSNVHHLNNLFLGAQSSAAIFSLSTYTNYSTSDYNGFRPNPKAAVSFAWNSPPFDVKADYDYTKKLTVRRYKTLGEYSKDTGQETHSILVDYNIFENVKMPDESDPQRLYNPEDYDFRLKAGSAPGAVPSANSSLRSWTGPLPQSGSAKQSR